MTAIAEMKNTVGNFTQMLYLFILMVDSITSTTKIRYRFLTY